MDVETGAVEVDGLRVHFRSAGQGEAVLLLHGWPTSSHLWRNVMPPMAEHRRVLALDLPGFGASDKPLDRRYDMELYDRVIEGFLASQGAGRVGLVVHDMGGPVGLEWARRHPERLEKLAFLNTIVYPELSWAVRSFLAALRVPGVRSLAVSPWGLAKTLRIGVYDPRRLADDAVAGFQAPFVELDARRALVRTALDLDPAALVGVAAWLPTVKVPVRVIYGARDRVLPDIARTVARLQQDLPQAEVTVLEDCGHFLQEERPEELGRLLADFFAGADPG